jgi:hypothetical protein
MGRGRYPTGCAHWARIGLEQRGLLRRPVAAAGALDGRTAVASIEQGGINATKLPRNCPGISGAFSFLANVVIHKSSVQCRQFIVAGQMLVQA